MPRYRFVCEECTQQVVLFRGLNDSDDVLCGECGVVMRKALTTPHIATQYPADADNQPVGQITEDFIKESRDDLKKQREDVKEIFHEPS